MSNLCLWTGQIEKRSYKKTWPEGFVLIKNPQRWQDLKLKLVLTLELRWIEESALLFKVLSGGAVMEGLKRGMKWQQCYVRQKMANRPRRENESWESYREWLKAAKKVEKLQKQGKQVIVNHIKGEKK